MKPIIIATDYSVAAKHAADYAAQLSKIGEIPIEIFHSWMIPAIGGEGFAIPYPVSDLEELERKAIVEEATRVEKRWDVKLKMFHSIGFPADEIENYCRKRHAGLVIMGIRHTEPIEQMFGSVVTAFIKRDKFPVLVIPEKAKFKVPKKILLATDLVTKEGWHELDMLKDLAAHFDAEIHIMNAATNKLEYVSVGGNAASHRLEKFLKDYPHTWHYENDGDVLHSISKIASEINADWIAAIPHRMNWVQRLFKKSTTRDLAFNTRIPLLILPEHHIDLKK